MAMEFLTYLLLILIVILSLIFGIYLSLITFEELPEIYYTISFFRTILIVAIIGCIYFLDVNIYYKIIFSTLLIFALGVRSLYFGMMKYAECLLFILFGLAINLSLKNTKLLLPISVLIMISNFLFSSLMFNKLIPQKNIININKFKIYRQLLGSMSIFIICFILSSVLFYFFV